MLAGMPCREWMSMRIVIAQPEHSVENFMDRALYEHSFQELPVVDDAGRYLGMVSQKAIRAVPREAWAETKLSTIMDRHARAVSGAHSMAIVERDLALGHHDYLPVVNPKTDQLVGILSGSDILHARQVAQDAARPRRPKLTVIPIRRKKETSNDE